MPNNRLGHRKSRNGCLRCKQRRVKCDESIPCSNCLKHELDCSLVAPPLRRVERLAGGLRSTAGGQLDAAVAVSTQTAPNAINRDSRLSPLPATTQKDHLHASTRLKELLGVQDQSTTQADHRAHITKLQELVGTLSSEVEALKDWETAAAHHEDDDHETYVQDLQLMHHFSVSAIFTILDDQSMLEAWQSSAPRPSLSKKSFRNAVLALSAHHRSHLFPEEQGSYKSVLRRYRRSNTHQKADIGDPADFFLENIVHFAIRTYLFALSPLCGDESALFGLLPPLDVLQNLRNTLLSEVGHDAGQGSISCLINGLQIPTSPLSEANMNRNFARRILLLESLLQFAGESRVEGMYAEGCIAALKALGTAYESLLQCPTSRGRAWLWAFLLPDGFQDWLMDRDPYAHIVLAHCAVLVKLIEDDTWFAQGWSARAMLVIRDSVPGTLSGWLDWPRHLIEKGVSLHEI